MLARLLEKLQEIRDALDDDAVFNVVGEVLPAAHLERILRDYYAGALGDADLEERMLMDVKEERFRAICQHALEGLATRTLNLEMLVERRARAQERRLVPETTARFMDDAARLARMKLARVKGLAHSFDPGPTPALLERYETETDWRLAGVATRYGRISTDRLVADEEKVEWVTPGHPLFEAVRRHALVEARAALAEGACFVSLDCDSPARIDINRAAVVDGLGDTVHERLFAVRQDGNADPTLHETTVLADLQPVSAPAALPAVASAAEPIAWLNERALTPFLEEVRRDRTAEIDRIAAHIDLSLGKLIRCEDLNIGRFFDEAERGVEGAAGRLKIAEDRYQALLERRRQRGEELARQRALTLQRVERVTSVLVFPHPERNAPDVRSLRPDTEAIAMRVVIDHERAQGREVEDAHLRNLGYDITSLDVTTGELRLIEIKGLAGSSGTVALTPHEREVAEDRPDCFWLSVVADCKSPGGPRLQPPVLNPARLPWHEVRKVEYYALPVGRLTAADRPDGDRT